MGLYDFICPGCGYTIEATMPKTAHACPKCGVEMNLGNVISDTMGEGRQFATPHFSESLAISPSQVIAHKKMFPDVLVREDGAIGFTSVGQQDKYLKTCGFEKKPQKIR
jgi:hypothetical protein